MNRSPSLNLRKVVASRTEATAHLRSPGDAVLVERGVPRWLVIACPCGCGAEIPVNLDARAGKAWRIYRNPRSGLSLFPSVWRDTDCRSHFIVWRDSILLFGSGRRGLEPEDAADDTARLMRSALQQLPEQGSKSFVDVADTLREIPWDVLRALREAVRQGLAQEEAGQPEGRFSAKSGNSRRPPKSGWWA